MPQEKPKRRIKNLKVEFISLVDSAANKREFVYKAEGLDSVGSSVQKSISIRKFDEEKGILYGVVYAPDEVDTDGDTMLAKDIEAAAHDFLEKGKTNRVDKQHDEDADEGFVVESFILKGEHPEFPDDPEGTWCVAIKVSNEDTRELIKNGEITGLSLGGYAEMEDLETEDVAKGASEILTAINGMKDLIRKKFERMGLRHKGTENTFKAVIKSLQTGELVIPEEIKKDFEASLVSEELRQAIYALDSSNWSAMRDEDVSDKKAALITNAEQFIEHMNGLTISKSKNEPETPMSTEEPKKTETTEVIEKGEDPTKMEKLQKQVDDLKTELETLKKAAPVSQANNGQDHEIKKNYNPKAPISFGFNS